MSIPNDFPRFSVPGHRTEMAALEATYMDIEQAAYGVRINGQPSRGT